MATGKNSENASHLNRENQKATGVDFFVMHSIQHQMWERIKKFGLLLILSASISAYGGQFAYTMSWKEEVRLHDGQIVVAERSFNLDGDPALDSDNRAALNQTVTFNVSNSRSILWKTDFRDSESEPNSLNLILFDIVEGVPYIATYPASCIAYNKWKRPNPPQVLFKYEGGQWKRITLEEFPLNLEEANVIVGRPSLGNLKPFYSVDGVIERNSHAQAEYKTVLRGALPQERVEQMCEKLIFYRGCWIMPSDAVARRMLDTNSR